MVRTAETRTYMGDKLIVNANNILDRATGTADYLQVHSWHQPFCDAENQDASHEIHILVAEAHSPRCRILHCGLGKPANHNATKKH